MAKFVCKNCKYRFEGDGESKNKICPYCGKKDIKEEQDAEELIEEVGEILR